MSSAQILLAKLHRLLLAAERCPVCVGPSCAFDGEHQREWQKLRRELIRELGALPN